MTQSVSAKQNPSPAAARTAGVLVNSLPPEGDPPTIATIQSQLVQSLYKSQKAARPANKLILYTRSSLKLYNNIHTCFGGLGLEVGGLQEK